MSLQLVKEHRKCRLCNSKNLSKVLDIGNQFVNNFVEKDNWKGIFCPLTILHCKDCDLYQLQHTAPQEILYKGTYWYKSGVTDLMKNHLKELAEEASSLIKDKTGSQFLDIGANDGTLLKNVPENIFTVGVEPATNLQDELKSSCDLAVKDLWSEEVSKVLTKKTGNYDIVTAIGMFYDLDDPIDFVKGIWCALKDKGVFIAQLMCMENMLITNDLGNICHEHIEFYTLRSLEVLFRKCKLKIYKISKNAINGQSYRIYAVKMKDDKFENDPNIQSLIDSENIDIKSFKKNIDYSKNKVVEFITKEKNEGKITAAFGASTKGNCILQYFGLNNEMIPFAVDRAPWKEGLYTIGSWIPIKFENDPERYEADYYLVLPWGFIDEFLEREEKFLSNGGKFIVPFPYPRIVDKDGEKRL